MDTQVRPAIRVAVAAPFEQLVGLHGRAAEYADEIELCGAISDSTRVLEQARRLQPEVLLLSGDLGLGGDDFLARLGAVAPATRLVVLIDRAAAGLGDQVAGGDVAVVDAGANAAALRAAIVGAARRVEVDTAPPAHLRAGDGVGSPGELPTSTDPPARSVAPSGSHSSPPPRLTVESGAKRPAHTVVVFSGKGGVGKSIVATNLATALALGGRRVALVDLNLQYGDAGILLHLETQPSTIETIAYAAAAGALDPSALDQVMATTAEGLRVLLAPRSPEASDLVTSAGLGAILGGVAATHDHLVIDSPAHLEERILGAIEVADTVLLVTSGALTAIKATKATLRLLQSLGIDPSRVGLVLNNTRKRAAASADIEGALHFPVLATLPYEPRLDDSVDSGRPLVVSHPRSRFSQQVQVVARRLERDRDADVVGNPGPRPARWRLRFLAR